MNVQQALPQKQKPKRTRNFWIRLAIGLIALLCLIVGGLVWILSTERVISSDWSTILPVVFIVLAAIFALLTWLFPFSPVDTKDPGEIPFSTPHPQISRPSSTVATSPQRQAEPSQPIWNVPFPRNPFFTGREQLLTQLHDNLTKTKVATLTQPQAISGLGGIGKTQTAVEYAYRHQEEYQAILWVHATTRDTIITSFVELAALLTLPEQQEQDQQKVIAAVKGWFATHDHWLLIFDNADDLSLVEAFLPARGKGHLLLTTRTQAPGTLAHGINVEEIDLEEGTLLLLRRARLLPPEALLDQTSGNNRAVAETIVRKMDGLPLALDQAGAYIEETQCRLSSYLETYQRHPSRLLQQRGGSSQQHPEPVATTWALSFEQVERLSPLAADLLRFCSFLAPDAIPEQLIIDGASKLTPSLHPIADDPTRLDDALGTLLRFSLVKRKPEEATISVHRLVQTVLRESMDAATQEAWAKRTVRALNQAFPDVSDYRTWTRCQEYLPHAQACVLLMDQWALASPVAGRLLNQVGYYLNNRAQYAQAELLYQRAIAIVEKVLDPEHPDLAAVLNNLATLYSHQGKHEQAVPLYQRAIAIGEKVLGPEHLGLTTSLSNLATLYADQGKYEQAEPLLQRAIAIEEKVLGPEHPRLATDLNNLATLYADQGKYEQAVPLYQRAIAIDEKVLGPEHPTTIIMQKSYSALLETMKQRRKKQQ